MTNNDFMKFFDPEMAKNMPVFGFFPFDMNALMETQRKNLQAFSEAHQRAIEGLQAAAQKQSELLTQLIEDSSVFAKEIMGEGSPEQKVAKQTDLMKKNYEKSMGNMKEISDMVSKSNQQASDIINKRVTASLTEIKSIIEKDKKAENKKAA